MRHCRQCRADAVGLLGEDRGQEFTLDQLPEDGRLRPVQARRLSRGRGARARRPRRGQARSGRRACTRLEAAARLLVAVATKGGGRVNQHFGHATRIPGLRGRPGGRALHRPSQGRADYCQGGFGEDATLDGVIKTLDGVDAVLCAKIGDCPKEKLRAAGIATSDAYAYDYIETAIGDYYANRFGAPQLALGA